MSVAFRRRSPQFGSTQLAAIATYPPPRRPFKINLVRRSQCVFSHALFSPIRPIAAPVATVQAFEFDLQSYLLTALSQPVYPVHVPQQFDSSTEVLPCYTYTFIDANRVGLLAGGSLGLVDAVYEIDIYANIYDDLVTMGETLRQKLDGFHGLIGTTTVRSARLHHQASADDPPPGGSDRWTYHRINSFRFFYLETVPTF